MPNSPKCGDIYLAEIPQSGEHIQFGKKYIIILSNDINNIYSTNVQCLILTSKKHNKNYLPVHYMFPKGELEGMWLDTIALGETVTTIDKNNLIQWVGKLKENQYPTIAEILKAQMPILAV